MKNDASGVNILFIANGKNRNIPKLKKELESISQHNFRLMITSRIGEAIHIALENCHMYSHIVAVGGDGTLNEVVNGVMNGISEKEGPVLSLIPSGTANDFARTLSFPGSFSEFYQALKTGKIVKSDVGSILCINDEGTEKKAWFINIADAGIGSAVVQEVKKQPVYLNASLAFFRAILASFRRYRNISVTCKTEQWEWEGRIKMLVVAIGKYFGSGMCIAPHAIPDDGKFAVTIAADISTIDYLKYLPSLKSGKMIKHPELHYKEACYMQLTSEEPCPIEADGEIIGFTPAEFRILPKRLRFLVR